MAKKRKTVAEKRIERERRAQQVWDDFIPKLRAVNSYVEARLLLSQAVPETHPGRKYYSDFGFFMHYFSPPDGASSTELAIYIDLLEKFDKEGTLKAGAKDSLIRLMRSAMDAKDNPYP